MNSRISRLVTLILLLFTSTLRAQTITVTDAVSNTPLSNVRISNAQRSIHTITDVNGHADISTFSSTDTIFMELEGYLSRPYNTKVLQLYNYKAILFPDVLQQDQWVHVSSYFSEKRERVVTAIFLLPEKKIKLFSAQHAIDLIALSGIGSAQKKNQGTGTNSIVGLNYKNNIYSLDGIKLSSLLPVDINTIEQIEIAPYSSPVLYGSNTMNGATYFQSKQPLISTNDSTPKVALDATTRFSTVNRGITAHVDLGIRLKKFASLSSISVSNFNAFKTGSNRSHGYNNWGKVKYYATSTDSIVANSDDNIQAYTSYKRNDIVEKITFNLSPSMNVLLHAQLTQLINSYDAITLYASDSTKPAYAENYYPTQQYLLSYAKFHSQKTSKLANEYFITLGYQQNNQERISRQFESIYKIFQEKKLQTYSINIDLLKKLRREAHFMYGMEWYYNQLLNNASIENSLLQTTQPGLTEYPNEGSYWQHIAGYVNYLHQFNSAILLNAGVRLNYHSLLAHSTDSILMNMYGSDFIQKKYAANGMLGMNIKLATHYLLNYTFSTSYHIPDVDELTQLSTENFSVHIPNPSLLSSYIFRNEIGLKITLGESTIIVHPSLYISYMQNATADTLWTLPLPMDKLFRLRKTINIGHAILWGARYQFTAKLGEYATFESSLYYTNGFLTKTHEPLPYLSPLSATASLSYQYKSGLYCFYILCNGAKSIEKFSDYEKENQIQLTENGLPAWFTINFCTQYDLYKNISMGIGIENLLDNQYKTYGSTISAAGRNITITLRTKL